ncbi:histidine phosphatase family protein [Ilumatobacter nonamiensis]|uniref:histidine phosphatase family protein n=1 Tax=Ilumatobacter nonamiensis TaxID=467093 RepID=UPI0003471676|nr:histidine phosphatase family protein [Ilumatobacter nonamiensis]
MTDANPKPTRLVLIRHGESASNAGGWLSGQETCGGLTEHGIAQAEALQKRLLSDPDLRPDRVVVSTMRRAVHTAEVAAEPTGVEVEQFADLMERTSGEAEGLTIEQYTERYGKPPWTDWTNPLSPGGESGPEFSARVRDALDRVATEGAGRTTWVVCHGGVIMATAIGRWPGAELNGLTDLATIPLASPMNSSISEWVVNPDGGWRMVRYNDHSHLVGVSNGDAPAPI